ncbi:hypothetical protein BU23DRAFT_494198, partial [Bimuria novae-zelandiae CBS 107.79]
WVAFIILSFLSSYTFNIYRVTPVLDFIFRLSTRVDMVISIYKELLESVASLLSFLYNISTLAGARVHVYVKIFLINLATIK